MAFAFLESYVRTTSISLAFVSAFKTLLAPVGPSKCPKYCSCATGSRPRLESLTEDHKNYLSEACNQLRETISKATGQAAQKPTGVDKIKSQSLVNGLKTMVNEAQNMADLHLVVEQFNGSKAKIDPKHAQDFLSVYAQRKAFLEDQLSMFGEAPAQQESYADRAIARIYAAKNQDDINAEFMDPEFEEQSDQDKQRITIAAQEREQQLLG